ncbi:hypothetical protein HYW46_03955 [Candidatus Daviesbacteria bacterium]|nr:hypothetical protein [Candidatus Daviesbacteria bacterium]
MTNQKGQSLLEIAVTAGVVAVVLSALTVVTIIGLRNSQFSRNQTQATKLAQEAMEKVKTIKSRNLAVCGPYDTNLQWSNLWSTSCPSVNNACTYILKDSGTPCTGAPASIVWLNYQVLPETLTISGTDFKRQVIVLGEAPLPGVPGQKTVTVLIQWTDTTGTHESRLVTVLAEF